MNRSSLLPQLRQGGPKIVPSLLQCDFAHLADEVRRLEEAGAELLHLDVMDGHFVPNLTYGPVVVQSLRRVTRLPLEAHLMISNPEKHLDAFVQAGCDIVIIHVEAVNECRPLLETLRQRGVVAGLSLNPSTPVERIDGYLQSCDLVLVMSVVPGSGGQVFMDSALEKLRRLWESWPEGLLEVDGGINRQTVGAAAGAGARLLVAGSAIFGSADYAEELSELTRHARAASAGPSGVHSP